MKKILIIEDNIYLQNVLKSVIEESGYNPLVAVDKDGNAALIFNSAGMYRASLNDAMEIVTEIYK